MKDLIEKAAKAHTDLTIFGAVIDLVESGHLYTNRSHAAAAKIVSICKREQQRCLRDYDDSVRRAVMPALRNMP